jgi:hypothetical protein
VDDGDVVVGHVGDTRLYKLRHGRMEKLTKDHSPVGEREDAGEISEADAMRHPRRNEVYRDVGSETHRPGDTGFIDVFRAPFEQDSALLLCSDGLTDLVDSATIKQTVEEYAGHGYEIVRALIDSANDAGGKDNVTVVYVEGSRFADGETTGALRRGPVARGRVAVESAPGPPAVARRRGRWRVAALLGLLLIVIGWALYAKRDQILPEAGPASQKVVTAVIVVEAGQSIGAAIGRAQAGAEILVEPGEYRERLHLASGVRVRSRVSRGASIRLPADASEADAAIIAVDITNAEITGFRIVGDALSPLGTAVSVANAGLTLTDLEISGARRGAVIFGAGTTAALLASDLHDNQWTAVEIKAGAQVRVVHNTFARNAGSERAPGWILVEAGVQPEISGNSFDGARPESIIAPADVAAVIAARNSFSAPLPAARGGRAGRDGRRGGR